MLSSLISTLAGSAAKVVVATSVAAAAVGGAYVSEDVDLPLFDDPSAAEEIVEAPEELAFEDTATIDEEIIEQDEAGDEVVVEEVDVDETVEDSSDAEEGESDMPSNHGSEVSAFVHETELEGCAKGHAVAALASGKEEKADKECPAKDGAEEADVDDDDEDEADVDDDEPDDDDAGIDEGQKTEKSNQGNGRSGNNGKNGDK